MLRLAGVHLHPGIRALFGVVLVFIGVLAHRATPLILIGAVLAILGFASLMGYAAAGADEHHRR